VDGDLLAAHRTLQPAAQVLACLLRAQSLHRLRILHTGPCNKLANPRCFFTARFGISTPRLGILLFAVAKIDILLEPNAAPFISNPAPATNSFFTQLMAARRE
jgi:hypothetical protein